MTWMVQIVGEPSSLGYLANQLQSSAARVTKEVDGYYLWSDLFTDAMSVREVTAEATSLLSTLRGVLAMTRGSLEPLTSGAVARIDPDGTKNVFVSISEKMHARINVGAVIRDEKGNIVDSNNLSDEERLLKLALDNSTVAKVMRLFGIETADWVGLYRVYEVIESDVGGMLNLVSHGWATKQQIRSFKHTANSPSAIGDLARHGSEGAKPPTTPMKIEEAEELITRVIQAWIATKK